MINAETKLYISASSQPGNFGATVFNTLFEIEKIDALYLPRRFTEASVLVQAMMDLNIQGCGVSMPLKSAVVNYMNSISETARVCRSVNTIVNQNGKLLGHNTDVAGVVGAIGNLNCDSYVIYGAGAVVPSICYALKNRPNVNISMIGRNLEKAKHAASLNQVKTADIVPSGKFTLINATPNISLNVDPLFDQYLNSAECYFEVPVGKNLSEISKLKISQGGNVIIGAKMSAYQLKEQFQIYTGKNIGIEIIEGIVREKYLTEEAKSVF